MENIHQFLAYKGNSPNALEFSLILFSHSEIQSLLSGQVSQYTWLLSKESPVFCCYAAVRKMCSCQHLNAQYQCLSPHWDLGCWSPLSQLTDDPAKAKTDLSLSPLLCFQCFLSPDLDSQFSATALALRGFDRQTSCPGRRALPL